MYQKMYAIDALPLDARTFYARVLLQKALSEAEEVMLSWTDDEDIETFINDAE